jgi:peptidoglycan/LPS O-acetylase OafA/YrhL
MWVLCVRIVPAYRYETLDGLRGIAALCVMAGHFGQSLNVYWPPNLFLAVDIFFMMSGFVIAHSYGERLRSGMPAWSYLGRRIVRLYPMFIAGLLLGIGALYFGVRNGAIDYRTEDILVSTLLNAVYLPFLNSAHIGNAVGTIFPADPPAWSLFLEVLASGGFLLLFGLRLKALMAISAVSMLLMVRAGSYFAHVEGQSGIWLNTGFDTVNMLGGLPRVGFGFTLGVLLHGLLRDGQGRWLASAVAQVPYASFALYAALFAVLLCPKSVRGFYPFAVLMALAPAIVFVSAYVRPRRGLETQAARFLGWISYPIYCLHIPIMRFVMFGGFAGRSTFAILAVGAAATMVAAAVVTKWYEEPVRAALSRRLSGPRPVSPSGAD